MNSKTVGVVLALLVTASLVTPAPALGHEEREPEFPSGDGSVPEYRTTGPYLVVCRPDTVDRILDLPEPHRTRNLNLLAECAFQHIQAAVDAVQKPGTRILVQPGVYQEEPSLVEPSEECLEHTEGDNRLSYADQVACPHLESLIAVLGDSPTDEDRACTTERLCRLQMEGTGGDPGDVVIDARFQKENALRADRADGFFLTNVLVQRATLNSVYVLETDGFAIDDTVTRWNDKYGVLVFAVDHGLITDCEAYGNSDAGLYPGSASDLHGARPAVEIARCVSHHNAAGYSGTAGNSVYAHHNEFHHNALGVVMDSFFPNHPGLPQDSATFEENLIHSNNVNYYDNFLGEDPPCERPIPERGYEEGVVCPAPPLPVGTGIMIAGGNANLITRNHFWDNWRVGAMLFTVPAVFREETDPAKAMDTSHFNRFLHNAMGLTPGGAEAPNGLDFWWDEGGTGNCWEGNHGGDGGVSSDPGGLPECGGTPLYQPPDPVKSATLAPCALYDREENHHPAGCDWMTTPQER